MMNLNIFVVNIFLWGDPFLSKSVFVFTITLIKDIVTVLQLLLNVHPRTDYDGRRGGGAQRYSSTLSLTSAIDGVRGQRHVPAALPPGKTRNPLYRRLGGTLGPALTGEENLAPHRISISRPPSP